MKTVDDASRLLVLRARGRDAEAFGALVESHWARLVALARSVVGDADAEDAVQEGLVTAWMKLARLRDPEAFPSWILRIVTRRCLRLARGRLRLLPWPEGRDDPDLRAPEAPLCGPERRADVPASGAGPGGRRP